MYVAGRTTSETTTEVEASTEDFGLGDTGEINEEEFQHALVKYMLGDINPEAADAYSQAFSIAQENGISVEDAVKAALQAVVSEGLLGQDEAEKINGITFRAAQLDDNLEALYDGRGGPNDPTIATASVTDATAKAKAVFEAAEAGAMEFSARPLDAPSNLAPSQVAQSDGRSFAVAGGQNEFLWKPQSDSDGRLVVLLPSQYTGQVVSAGIYSSVPPTKANRIEEGRYAGDANGGRAHFRFSKSGGSYPDGVYVVAKLNDGRTVSFPIKETSERQG